MASLLKTTTSADSPLDASQGDEKKPLVSEFVTLQSLTNFSAMTGAISAAWSALQKVQPRLESPLVPLAIAVMWAIASVLMSLDGLKKKAPGGELRFNLGTVIAALVIAFLNALVLTSAVFGARVATA